MQTDLSFRVVIPARYQSTRFPGKPLQKIAGREMVLRVYDQALRSQAQEVVIATDNKEIADVALAAGAEVCMTSTEHATGTDRLVEVVDVCQWPDDTIIVNVQGDEPLMPVACINQVASNLCDNTGAVMATLGTQIADSQEYTDPNVVKVVFDTHGMALYFSRAGIPHYRDSELGTTCPSFRHLGIYAYRAGYLKSYPSLSNCGIEKAEMLEQLRVLHNGDRIHVGIADELPGPGVDTPEQLAVVESIIAAGSDHTQTRG